MMSVWEMERSTRNLGTQKSQIGFLVAVKNDNGAILCFHLVFVITCLKRAPIF
jgi:hypothetical protein